jgi:precorrin-2 C20-methyltransferase/precorrin-3B C17-methyltransferase
MGQFWAIGVGPGDPELLTVKAVRLLRAAHVVYHAGPGDDQGRALDVVRELLRPDQRVHTILAEAMAAVSNSPDRSAYRAGVERIAADCRRGLDVAFITEGDPTLYSTASQVWELLAEVHAEVQIEVVPGVSSITAAAARVRWPLARKDEMLAVVPAGYHPDRLPELLDEFSTVCLLKVGGALPRLRAGLGEATSEHRAVYAENVGTAAEWITENLEAAAGRRDYFSLVLARRAPGRPAGGKLWVVGLGPGDSRLLTPAARRVLRSAEVIVGYTAYLEALGPLGLRAEMRASPIGAETERARLALELAAAGRRVALVSSGDAGVYGMASLVLEAAAGLPGVQVEVVPGVTAVVAAAALLGAPLGHDFACVSLSDLLTPWPVIERRLDSAGQGDFVIALYNPCSQRRTWQLPRARDALLRHRPPATPVGLVDRAHRPGTRAWLTTLAELSCDGVGMETLIIVGNSQTRVVGDRLVTPRGYRGRS